MTNTALILIDIQNDYFPDFSESRMPLPAMKAAAGNAALLLAAARRNGTAIFHIRHVMASDAAPFFLPGSAGSEIHDSVQPLGSEEIIEKGRPNSFKDTRLEALLRDRNVDQVTLCGAMSQMCVDATARAAADMGFKVTVAQDACAAAAVTHDGIDVPAEMVHAAIMAPLAASYATVQPTRECLPGLTADSL